MSNNLNLSQVTAAQNQKEVTINQQAGEIDAAITAKIDFTIDGTNARTLTDNEFRRNMIMHIINAGSPPTADIVLTVPAISRGTFAILNTTSFNVTVTIASQPITAPVIAPGADTPSLLTCDGVNVRLASSAGSSGGSTDFNKTVINNVVAASTTTQFNLTGFFNRGLIHTIRVTEIGGSSTGTYDLSFYSKDTFVASALQYSVTTIDSTANNRVYLDDLAVFYRDDDGSDELHVQIANNDATNSMTFTIEIDAEVFETGIGGGGGDVVGPASAVDSEVVLFSGTTGKLIKSAGVLLSSKAGVTTGVWTPILAFGGGSVGITYILQSGRYTRIHDLVFCSVRLTLSNKGTSTGNATLSLPFSAHATDGMNGSLDVLAAFNLAGLTSPPSSIIQAAAMIAEFLDWGASGHLPLDNTNFTNNSDLWLSGFYRASTSV